MIKTIRNITPTYILIFICLFLTSIWHYSFKPATPYQKKEFRYLALSTDPVVIRRLLGMRYVAAEVFFLDAILKSSDEPLTSFPTNFFYAVTAAYGLDKLNFSIPGFSGLYLSVVLNDVRGATLILRNAVEHLKTHPQAPSYVKFNIYYSLGYHLLFEEQNFEEGAQFLKLAGNESAAHPLARQLAQRAATEEGRLEIAHRVLSETYARYQNTNEPRARLLIIEDKMLRVSRALELVELNQKYSRFAATSGAYSFNRKRRLDAFFRSIGHPRRNFENKPFVLDTAGRITVE